MSLSIFPYARLYLYFRLFLKMSNGDEQAVRQFLLPYLLLNLILSLIMLAIGKIDQI